MDNIIKLNVPTNNLVATFEDLTERARDNQITYVSVVALTKEGDVISGLAGDDKRVMPFHMIGALYSQVHEITHRDIQSVNYHSDQYDE